ncbi:MAG TPA: VIT1/CCC1 transporter family protein [Bacteroidia bacterium]|nr:VIT1/CCC1 transporter family protein [Bacteroidia bacterium]
MDTHLHHEHIEKHFGQSETVRDIVIGMADGLTVPFALAAGLSGVSDIGNGIIITAGLAEIIAGSIAMGLGGYLAGKTEVDHYNSELAREYREIKEFYETEKREVRDIFAEYGLSEKSQNEIVDELAKDDDKWVDFMMKFELGLDKPDINRARQSARNIGVAYIVGGIVPLSAYMFTATPHDGLIYSSLMTVACLLVFGYYKSKATGQPPAMGALKVTAIGVIAAAAAYFIAGLIGG